MYGVSIDRSKEPESAKTMKGITEFSDFEYFYDKNKNLQYIIARNQTRMLESKRYESSELKKLWEHSFENESIGAISNFSLEYAATVTELSQRPNIPLVKMDNLGTPSFSTALATETKFSYVRFLLSNKVSTLLGNTADFFFAYGKRKLLFQPFEIGWLSPKLAAILARPKQPSDVTGCIALMPR